MKKKLISALLVLTMGAMCFAGCGKKDDDKKSDSKKSETQTEEQAPAVAGEKQTWGNVTVMVPEGMIMTGGGVADKDDPDSLWLQKDGDLMSYFLISIKTPEEAASDIAMSKSMNGGEDIAPFEVGGVSWSGMGYEYSGKPVFQIAGDVNGVTFEVMSFGFDPHGDITMAVLESLEGK